MTTRRQFLAGCSLLTFTAALAPAELLGELRPAQTVALDQLGYAAFASQLGTSFIVPQASTPALKLKLVNVAQASAAPSLPLNPAGDAHHEKFSLLFRGSADLPLKQDTHLFEHPDLGQFAMFIVPVNRRDAGGAYYEAVFNRPAQGTAT